MPVKYDYRAVNNAGEVITGTISADDDRTAIRSLQRQGLDPVELSGVSTGKQRARGRAPRRNEMAVTLHQLTVLLKAGVPVDVAVSSLADTVENPVMAMELEAISKRLRRGERLSDAFREARLDIPSYVMQLTQAGEMTGQLPQSLSDGVAQLDDELRTLGEMRNALIYPAILVFSGIGAVILMFTLVVPKFTKLLSKADADVPFLGRAILATGQFFNDHMMLVAGVSVGMVVAAYYGLSQPSLRSQAWDLLNRLPLIGPWLQEVDFGRWANVLATLLNNRIELTRSLELAQQGINSPRLRANLSQVTRAVRGGSSLADALQDNNAITPTGYGLVKVGQESGELASMLRSLASLYQESSKNRMKRFLTVLEPLAILMIGGVIGLIMTGIMLTITSVHSIAI